MAAEYRQVVNAHSYWLNGAGIWVPTSATNPLPTNVVSHGTAEEGSVTGTTTNAYVDAWDWDVRDLGSKIVLIENTDGVNALRYRVYTRSYYTGIDGPEVDETVLIAAAIDKITLAYTYSRVIIQVIDDVALSHATYQIDYIGGR